MGTAASIIITRWTKNCILSFIKTFLDGVALQQIWVKLPGEQFTTIVHNSLGWIDGYHNRNSRFVENLTHFFAITRRNEGQFDLMLILTQKLFKSFFVKFIFNAVVDVLDG